MKTLKLTERQRDVLYSVIKPYTEGIANLKNSKGDNTCFKTTEGRLITAEEALKIMETFEKEIEIIETGDFGNSEEDKHWIERCYDIIKKVRDELDRERSE